ncbi:MAG: ribulose-phosphate 3-epimerase [Elusimicrobia bacterium CG1_02_37_114]|nr:MAG: ribulose-phosphate 3-epimerase [Elusimicrobia bacterium CG1_02_37_114]PIZ12529.1 MAG: ribulose-phosphate 3-epimerase [Elusimicrobia bacterium CG_4_10_14_0_8_um_filter_37_32]
MIKIVPSILSADFSCLLKQIKAVEKTGIDMIHLDVMDGHFVPNITFGQCIINSLRRHTKLCFDTHLMILNPVKYVDSFASCGADILTIHLETITSPDNTFHTLRQVAPEAVLNRIKRLGKKVGLSVNPQTPIARVYEYIPLLDIVLIMSVEPGFGAQKLIPAVLKKISVLRKYIDANRHDCLIEVDGGINEETIREVVDAGADLLVCGNAIFGSRNISRNVTRLRKKISA